MDAPPLIDSCQSLKCYNASQRRAPGSCSRHFGRLRWADVPHRDTAPVTELSRKLYGIRCRAEGETLLLRAETIYQTNCRTRVARRWGGCGFGPCSVLAVWPSLWPWVFSPKTRGVRLLLCTDVVKVGSADCGVLPRAEGVTGAQNMAAKVTTTSAFKNWIKW